MTDSDLGSFDRPVLVFGGVYGNLEALKALLAEAAALDIPDSHMICTGDSAGYCADPDAVALELNTRGIPALAGNVERSLATGAADCACGFSSASVCAALAAEWYPYVNQAISDPSRRWMAGLPDRILFRMAGRSFAAVHGAPSRINKFVFASTPTAGKSGEMDLAATDALLCGHSGLPFTQAVGHRMWHNAGALGLPANDGTPRVWFSTLTPPPNATGSIQIRHHSLEYETRKAANKMRRQGLPVGYARALGSGLWPSLEILPLAERAQTGQPLAPSGGALEAEQAETAPA